MPWSEVFTNIEQGIADGLQLQAQAITGFSFDKVVKFGTHTQTLMTFHVAQVNAEDWDALSPELKDIVSNASAEALTMANDADRADEAKHLETASKSITFYTPSDAELAMWREPALKVWDQFKDKIDPTIMQRVLDVQK
jgi:TRAP-type C4-dicarboxylate transport system substrate-binding protein